MIVNTLIEKKVKLFYLVQVKQIIRDSKTRLFVVDESKDAVCFGTIIDNLAISLSPNKIYPIFNYSDDTKLNTYYVLNIYDYGEKFFNKNGYICFEEDPKVLKKYYQETINWYYNELLRNEENNIKNFEKEKVIRYERSRDI